MPQPTRKKHGAASNAARLDVSLRSERATKAMASCRSCYHEMAASTREMAPKMMMMMMPAAAQKPDDSLPRKADGSVDWARRIQSRTRNQPCTSLQTALVGGLQDIPEDLYRGIPVGKVHRHTTGIAPRVLTLSRDHLAWFLTHQTIRRKRKGGSGNNTARSLLASATIPFWKPAHRWWRGSSASHNPTGSWDDRYVRCLDVGDIDAVQSGVVGSQILEQAGDLLEDPSHAITVFHHGFAETLGLVIADPTHRKAVVAAMQGMAKIYATTTPWISPTALLLRYIWYDVDTDRSGRISRAEFGRICQRINLGATACDALKAYERFLRKLVEEQETRAATHAASEDSAIASPTTKFSRRASSRRASFRARKPVVKKELEYAECMQLLHQIRSGIWAQPKEESPATTTSPRRSQHNNTNKTTNKTTSLWDEIFGQDTLAATADDVYHKFLRTTQKELATRPEDASHLLSSLAGLFDLDNQHECGECRQNSQNNNNTNSEPVLTRILFEEFLLSKYNSAYDPALLQDPPTVFPDTHADYYNEPISRYWINTSHNTYLTGDQLRSRSSVQAYSLALYRGCKCLELDCWDGPTVGDNPVPVVFHGHTLTSKITFESILLVVKHYLASSPGSLPIILSLENHCSHPFQRTMARLLMDVFGTTLYRPPSTADDDDLLPSPDELRGKVVIKGKRPPDKEERCQRPTEEEQAIAGRPRGIRRRRRSKDGVAGGENGNEDDETDEDDDEDPYEVALAAPPPQARQSQSSAPKTKPKPPKIVRELAELTLFHGTKYQAFETSIRQASSHMHSIGESKITKILSTKPHSSAHTSSLHDSQTAASSSSPSGSVVSSSGGDHNGPSNAQLWRHYNRDHMTRTYPGGFRVDSSNYNPTLAWAMGCQLVALNFQYADAPLLLNDGRFRQAGGAGYVLKTPRVLNEEGLPLDNEESSSALFVPRSPTRRPKKPQSLRIQVVSGHCLPKPRGQKEGEEIDPYVIVEIHDVKASEGKEEYVSDSFKTSVVYNNGFCPTWGWISSSSSSGGGKKADASGGGGNHHNHVKTFLVHNLEVAMVLFQVVDEDLGVDDRIASAAVPVHCLREGYRSVPLFDAHCHSRTGPFRFATLLVRIDFLM